MDKTKKIKSDPSMRVFDEKTTFWELCKYKFFNLYFLKNCRVRNLPLRASRGYFLRRSVSLYFKDFRFVHEP